MSCSIFRLLSADIVAAEEALNQPVNPRIEWWQTALALDGGARGGGYGLTDSILVQLRVGMLFANVRARLIKEFFFVSTRKHMLAGDSEREEVGTVDASHTRQDSPDGPVTIRLWPRAP
jgi:hypothetical protein